MRSISSLAIVLFFGGLLRVLSAEAYAAPEEKTLAPRGAVQVTGETLAGTPPIQEQVVVLDPFFLIRKKGAKVWVERILVTIALAMPKNTFNHDLNSPAFRKIFYELLQSGEPETAIQAQAVAGVHRQMGMAVDARVHLSRDILIVR
jgi:hypothetical protein